MTWNRDAVIEAAGAAMEAALKACTLPPDPITGAGGIGLQPEEVAAAALPGIVASVTAEVRALHYPVSGREHLPNGVAVPWRSCSCGFRTHSACPTVRLLDDIDAAAGVV